MYAECLRLLIRSDCHKRIKGTCNVRSTLIFVQPIPLRVIEKHANLSVGGSSNEYEAEHHQEHSFELHKFPIDCFAQTRKRKSTAQSTNRIAAFIFRLERTLLRLLQAKSPTQRRPLCKFQEQEASFAGIRMLRPSTLDAC